MTFEIFLIMATAVGLGLQVWLFLESQILRRIRTSLPKSKPLLPYLAILNAVVTVVLAAGAIHWARLEAPGLFIERRVFGAALFLLMVAINIFQARREDWTAGEDGWSPYWRMKQGWQIAVVPIFALLFAFHPIPADRLTVAAVTALSEIVKYPYVGFVVGAVVAVHLLLRGLMALVGLALLRKIGA